jgi:hypothetical protein
MLPLGAIVFDEELNDFFLLLRQAGAQTRV